jgi:hypothetical protein
MLFHLLEHDEAPPRLAASEYSTAGLGVLSLPGIEYFN